MSHVNRENEKIFSHAFNLIPEIGPKRFKRLINHFSSLQEAWLAPPKELRQARLEEKVIEKILVARKEINPEKEWEKLAQNKIQTIIIQEKEYPRYLKEIYSPPPIFYFRGNLPAPGGKILAIVGTRKPSSYGRRVTLEITQELSQAGLSIVSGLALGIDALAHQATLEAEGKTYAVLASGLDNVYPATNRRLAQKILAAGGALISEHPLGVQPYRGNFPQRNRLISGLALGALIVEAPQKSGALITAHFALEQGREVLAVPGNIYNSCSKGTNNLIKLGAKSVSCADDVLEALNMEMVNQETRRKEIKPESQEEEILLQFLTPEPIHIDQLVKKSELETSQVNATLALMEIKGWIKNLGGQNYILAS